MILALLLLATIPHRLEPVRDSVDLIEQNHFYDDAGRPVFVQWILWRWNGNRHEVAGWRLDKESMFHFSEHPPCLSWEEGEVRGSYWRRTWTQFDPELVDRESLPKNQRRGIFGRRETP